MYYKRILNNEIRSIIFVDLLGLEKKKISFDFFWIRFGWAYRHWPYFCLKIVNTSLSLSLSRHPVRIFGGKMKIHIKKKSFSGDRKHIKI